MTVYFSMPISISVDVGIGTEAAQFPEKEYINGIFLAVYCRRERGEPKGREKGAKPDKGWTPALLLIRQSLAGDI